MAKIYNSWYIPVTETDQLYFECKGNKDSFPIIYLHWWPWCWFSESSEQYFDLEKDNVIFYDQRRNGKSIFTWESILENLDMNAMISDLFKVIEYFWYEKVNIFGGSWWSTLALVFTIQNPNKVQNIVLKGIWLSGKTPETEFLCWNWSEKLYPEAWENFLETIPKNLRNSKKEMFDYIWQEALQKNYTPLLSFQFFEGKLSRLNWKESEYEFPNSENSLELYNALIEFWFMKNACFISSNYILDNTKNLKHIFVSIVHGRYDCICPVENAWKLHKALQNSSLRIEIWWHSGSEENMLWALREEVKKVFRK